MSHEHTIPASDALSSDNHPHSEELKGNTTRKRQEEARARRRQLKQQQLKKQQSKKDNESALASSSGATAAVASSVTSSVTQPASFAIPALKEKSTAKPTAVATALQQRQLRQEQQLKQKAALVIQSFYRAYRSNCRLITEQSSLLSQRLKDLETLRNLIMQKTNADYVPPPATATVLVRQLLFVTRSIPWQRKDGTKTHTQLRSPPDDSQRLEQTLQYVLLPGLLGKDDNLDPILTWMDGVVGRVRLMELLRLCLVTLTSRSVPSSNVLSCIDSFLRTVLGISANKSARASIVEQCRVMLPMIGLPFPVNSPPATKNLKQPQSPPYAETGSALDIIQILRYQSLFGSGKPIPNDAEKRREACISSNQREQNDVLFQIALDAVQMAGAGAERHLGFSLALFPKSLLCPTHLESVNEEYIQTPCT